VRIYICDKAAKRGEKGAGKKIFVVRGSGGVGRSRKCENLKASDSEKVRATIWIVIRGNAGT